jgi:putative phage-type endonuclease
MDQGSLEWLNARIGRVTASRVSDVIAKTKSGYGAGRSNYEAQLIAERLTGRPQESYTNAAMQHGTDTEPQARALYEFQMDVEVVEVGFVPHPTIEMSGASPDGLVGDDGLLEIKAPQTATHIATLLSGKVPAKYITQMQWQMACTGRAWCDFLSFDPRMPVDLQSFLTRIPRDDTMIADLEDSVRAFLAEVDAKIERLNALRTGEAA